MISGGMGKTELSINEMKAKPSTGMAVACKGKGLVVKTAQHEATLLRACAHEKGFFDRLESACRLNFMNAEKITAWRACANARLTDMMVRLRHGLGITAIGVVLGVIVAYAAILSFGAVDFILSLWQPEVAPGRVGWQGVNLMLILVPGLAGLVIGVLLVWLRQKAGRIGRCHSCSASTRPAGFPHGRVYLAGQIHSRIGRRFDHRPIRPACGVGRQSGCDHQTPCSN